MVLDMRFVGKHGCLRTTRWMAFPYIGRSVERRGDNVREAALLAALPSKGRVFMYCNDYSTWRDIEHGLRRRRHGVTDMGPFRAQKL